MIDILLATYNGESYISELLSSIKAQSYSDWRLIVSDDYSTDKTQQIVEDFAKQVVNDVQIVNSGCRFGNAKDNFFYLLKHAKSDYVMFCDQDDVWIDTKIEQTLNKMKVMEQENGVDCPILVASDLYVADEKLNVISDSFFKFTKLEDEFNTAHFLCQNKFPGCVMMLNRALYCLACMISDTEDIVMHDSWVGLCASVFGKVACVNQSLILYRQHAKNSVGVTNAYSPKYLLGRLMKIAHVREENMHKICEASKFIKTYADKLENNDKKELMVEYSKLKNLGRKQYRKICVQYGIIKKPWYRSVIQILCCHR